MAAKLVTNGTGIKYEKSSSSDLIRRGAKDFSYLIGTIRWPTTVTAKPKTLIHHGKTKNLTAKTKYLTAKTKYLTAKPKTSQQNQILHSKGKITLVLLWLFAFAMKYLVLR